MEYLLISILTVITSYAIGHPAVQSPGHLTFKEQEDSEGPKCLYEGRTYHRGVVFHPDDCTTCHCPRHGDRALCSIQDCFYEPNCLRYERSPGSCCGVCSEYGCRHANGTMFKLGEVILDDRCERCVCPSQGGHTVCELKEDCPPASCVDPVRNGDSCCSTCPEGFNCWLEDKVIPAGEMVEAPGCRVCHCPMEPTPYWQLQQGGPRALCVIGDCS